MANKKGAKRKVLNSWNGYNVVQLTEYIGKGKERKAKSSKIVIQAGKKIILDGFKNTEEAMTYLKSL